MADPRPNARVYVDLAENLRDLRIDRKLSQAELATKAGFRQRYISDLERGCRPRSSFHVDALARTLGVTRELLLGVSTSPGCGAAA